MNPRCFLTALFVRTPVNDTLNTNRLSNLQRAKCGRTARYAGELYRTSTNVEDHDGETSQLPTTRPLQAGQDRVAAWTTLASLGA